MSKEQYDCECAVNNGGGIAKDDETSVALDLLTRGSKLLMSWPLWTMLTILSRFTDDSVSSMIRTPLEARNSMRKTEMSSADKKRMSLLLLRVSKALRI